MKILYTPISTLVPSLTPEQDAEILTAAGKDSVLVVAKTPDRQREEIVDADVLFGRVSPEVFTYARRLRYYHCLGAGVDSILSPELIESEVILASESPTSACASRSGASSASCGSRQWESSASAGRGAPSRGARSASA